MHTQEGFRVVDRGLNLQPVSNNARVLEQLFHAGRRVSRDSLRIKVVESFAIGVALLENRFPTQTGLCPFENEKLKQETIVMLHYPDVQKG